MDMSNAREIAAVERAKAVALVREWDIVIKALGDAGPTGVKAGEFSKPVKAARKPAKVTAKPAAPKVTRSPLTRAKMRIGQAKARGLTPKPEDVALVEAPATEQAAE